MKDSILVIKRTKLVSARSPARDPVLVISILIIIRTEKATAIEAWLYSHRLKRGIHKY